jgi:hypothetical protein
MAVSVPDHSILLTFLFFGILHILLPFRVSRDLVCHIDAQVWPPEDFGHPVAKRRLLWQSAVSRIDPQMLP